MFTMPYFGTRIGEEDFPRLDPGDSDERRLLIEGEHPEYHAALLDPGFDGEVDGVNPRLHIGIHEVVANQLWDGDPPEAWHAAKRHADCPRHPPILAPSEKVPPIAQLAGIYRES